MALLVPVTTGAAQAAPVAAPARREAQPVSRRPARPAGGAQMWAVSVAVHLLAVFGAGWLFVATTETPRREVTVVSVQVDAAALSLEDLEAAPDFRGAPEAVTPKSPAEPAPAAPAHSAEVPQSAPASAESRTSASYAETAEVTDASESIPPRAVPTAESALGQRAAPNAQGSGDGDAPLDAGPAAVASSGHAAGAGEGAAGVSGSGALRGSNEGGDNPGGAKGADRANASSGQRRLVIEGKPEYPSSCRQGRCNHGTPCQGTCRARVVIDRDGSHPAQIEILESAGCWRIDESVVEFLRGKNFPAGSYEIKFPFIIQR